jgi:transposase
MHQVDLLAQVPLCNTLLELIMITFLGIDVAKDTLAIALLGFKKPRKTNLPNSPAGAAQLLRWLANQHVHDVFACLEATGTYSEEIAQALHDAGMRVAVVNPARIASYAKSKLARNKTDPSDAFLIAQFAQAEQANLTLWTPPDPALRELRSLVRHLDALLEHKQAEVNRRAAGGHAALVLEALNAHIAFLEGQIKALVTQINDHLDGHPELRRDRELLESIKGIGSITAARILAEAGDLRRFGNARAVAAYAGLTPRQYRSGTSVQRQSRLSKVGNAALRRALYFPAIVAKQHNPVLQAFCARLAGRGMAKMAIIGAAMRKLLQLAYGVIASGRPFDPELAFAHMNQQGS